MEPNDAVMELELEQGAGGTEPAGGQMSRSGGGGGWSECSAYAMRTAEMGSTNRRHSKKLVIILYFLKVPAQDGMVRLEKLPLNGKLRRHVFAWVHWDGMGL
ncbi:uncharacterized protein LOC122819136 [Drosophila biarmipes]|uniref:uncharacterized protein LOC122819136 n=1 Tax=Drosophila biarmipes TaxID=125945 RepID=UPI001CDA79D8|nr:uncharacterized protein LOC122819136 [Drosophila biarmipes]